MKSDEYVDLKSAAVILVIYILSFAGLWKFLEMSVRFVNWLHLNGYIE